MKTGLVLMAVLYAGCNNTPSTREEKPTTGSAIIDSSTGVGSDNAGPQAPTTSKNYPPPLQPPFELPQIPTTDRIADDFIPFFSEGQDAQSDLAILRRDRSLDVPYARYFSLSFLDYLEFATREEKIAHKMDIIDSLSIILNHLSVEDAVVKPESINKTMSLFRIDIRDYGWSSAQWEEIVTGVNGSPYPYLNDFDPAVVDLQNELRTRVPIVRADWFLFEATKPASYHDLARIPATLSQLESAVGVNRANNILATLEQPSSQPKVMRAALAAGESGVSVNNRIIERHRANTGTYWLSYDFAAAGNNPEKSVFSSPIGPQNITQNSQVDFSGISFFNSDGGEVIYNLRNGLQGYMLVDGAGARLDEAPTFVVFDPRANDNQGIIENGLSCMECHATGMLPATDGLRKFINAADDEIFNDAVREAVIAMHPDNAKLNTVYADDSKIYLQAVDECLIVGKRNNVITQVINYYDATMTKSMLASELNITVSQLDRILPRLSLSLRSALQPLDTGSLERETFETIFAQLIEEIFRLQQQFRFSRS